MKLGHVFAAVFFIIDQRELPPEAKGEVFNHFLYFLPLEPLRW